MRSLVPWLVGILVLSCPLGPALAQAEGTCENPIFVSEGDAEFDLDTRQWSDNENAECLDSLATGPDIVLDFDCLPADGTVFWTAEFDAVVYYRRGSCDSPCVAASTTGTLEFSCNYGWGMDGVHWEPPYIIIDGLNGAAGPIHVHISYGINIPTHEETWGRIRASYR